MNNTLDPSDANQPKLNGDVQYDGGKISGNIVGLDGKERTVALKGNYSAFFDKNTDQEVLKDFFIRTVSIQSEVLGLQHASSSSLAITTIHPPLGSGRQSGPDQIYVKRSHVVGASKRARRGDKWVKLSTAKGGVRLYEQQAHTLNAKEAAKQILENSVAHYPEGSQEYAKGLLDRWDAVQDPRTSYGTGGFMVNCKAFRNLLDHIVCKNRHPTETDEKLIDYFYMPASVNLWRHEVSRTSKFQLDGEKGHTSLLRTGAIYDNRCGMFTTKDLEELRDDPKKRSEQQERIKNKIRKLEEGKSGKKTKQKLFAYQTALNLIGSEESINKALGERKVILQTQYLTLVWEHLKAQNGQFQGEEFSIAQLGLLNPSVSKISGSWTHFEDKEIEEMQHLFQEMAGADLVFGEVDAPYIEEKEGKRIIHLPQKLCAEGTTPPKTLRSHFINIDVQMRSAPSKWVFLNPFYKKAKKKGQTLARLVTPELKNIMENDTKEGGKELLKRLESGESGYTLAGEVLSFLEKKGFHIGVNCQSGKDRTGIVCESFMQQKVLEDTERLLDQFFKKVDEARIRLEEAQKALPETDSEEQKKEKLKDLEKEYFDVLSPFREIINKQKIKTHEELKKYVEKELKKTMTPLPLDIQTIALQIIAHNDSNQTEIKVDPRRIFTIDASRSANSKSFFNYLFKSLSSIIQGKKSEV